MWKINFVVNMSEKEKNPEKPNKNDEFLESLNPYTSERIDEKPMIFRNYVPKSPALVSFVLQASTDVAEIELNIEREVKLSLREFEKQQKEPLSIVAQKANWDLKRSYERKMLKLQKSTESAIAKLKKLKNTSV
jgi:hypothetical protein